tara:strand:+ start:12476 stop:12643 length:168 start_codon:yes stop_codon:yes gene_type:complete
MWLYQKLGPALSAAAPIGFTNKHLISLNYAGFANLYSVKKNTIRKHRLLTHSCLP